MVKDLKIIGFENSSWTQDVVSQVERHYKDFEIITPENFLKIKNKDYYQYLVGFQLDVKLRRHVISIIDEHDLDCPNIIGEYNILHQDLQQGKGNIICDFNRITQGCSIGNHCVISYYCYIAHYVTIGNNCRFYPGSMIMGKTSIGNHCVFGSRSTVLDKKTITDNVYVNGFSQIAKNIESPGTYGANTKLISKVIQT